MLQPTELPGQVMIFSFMKGIFYEFWRLSMEKPTGLTWQRTIVARGGIPEWGADPRPAVSWPPGWIQSSRRLELHQLSISLVFIPSLWFVFVFLSGPRMADQLFPPGGSHGGNSVLWSDQWMITNKRVHGDACCVEWERRGNLIAWSFSWVFFSLELKPMKNPVPPRKESSSLKFGLVVFCACFWPLADAVGLKLFSSTCLLGFWMAFGFCGAGMPSCLWRVSVN